MKAAILVPAIALALGIMIRCGSRPMVEGTQFRVYWTGSGEPNIIQHRATGRCYVGDANGAVIETERDVCEATFPAVERSRP